MPAEGNPPDESPSWVRGLERIGRETIQRHVPRQQDNAHPTSPQFPFNREPTRQGFLEGEEFRIERLCHASRYRTVPLAARANR